MFFKKKQATGVEWMIAGLGNPGKKYDGTRHNVGYAALDFAAKKWGVEVKKSKFEALCGSGEVAGHKVLLLKPQTFMNRSGISLLQASEYYKVPPERVLVLCDDVSLAPGVLRLRLAGSAGGHNGLKSIIAFLGEEFPRIKIGVGERPRPEYDLADWVLGRFTGGEKQAVEDRYQDISETAVLLMNGRASEAMGRFNGEGKT